MDVHPQGLVTEKQVCVDKELRAQQVARDFAGTTSCASLCGHNKLRVTLRAQQVARHSTVCWAKICAVPQSAHSRIVLHPKRCSTKHICLRTIQHSDRSHKAARSKKVSTPKKCPLHKSVRCTKVSAAQKCPLHKSVRSTQVSAAQKCPLHKSVRCTKVSAPHTYQYTPQYAYTYTCVRVCACACLCVHG